MTSETVTGDGRSFSLRPAREQDLAALRVLLGELDLPVQGLEEWWPQFVIAESEGVIVALAGVELYRDGALLRSVAVHPAWRGSGLGRRVVDLALDTARRSGRTQAYLLTTTAEQYFPRLGFTVVPRSAVPPSVQASVEFREACPASAIVMHRHLDPS